MAAMSGFTNVIGHGHQRAKARIKKLASSCLRTSDLTSSSLCLLCKYLACEKYMGAEARCQESCMQDMMTTWRFALPNQDAVDQIRQELAGLIPTSTPQPLVSLVASCD